MSFLCYHGGIRREKGAWGNKEIGVVVYGRIRRWYLCYTPAFTVGLVLENEQVNKRSSSGKSHASYPSYKA